MCILSIKVLILLASVVITQSQQSDYVKDDRLTELERKVDKLISLTESHSAELAEKERRIKHLEEELKQTLDRKNGPVYGPEMKGATQSNFLKVLSSLKSRTKAKYEGNSSDTTRQLFTGMYSKSTQKKVEVNVPKSNKCQGIDGKSEKMNFVGEDGAQQEQLYIVPAQETNGAPVRRPPRSLSDQIIVAPTAFHAYMNRDENNPGEHQIIVFGDVVTNVDNAYNQYSGIFTAPQIGIYHFAWTIYTPSESHVLTDIVKNNAVMDSILVDSSGVSYHKSATGNVILELARGDSVFIRTGTFSGSVRGKIVSNAYLRSTFTGFRISGVFVKN